MQRVIEAEQRPWLVTGDLNEIIDDSERFGGWPLHGKKLFLKEFMYHIGGIDLGFCRSKFTLLNEQNGTACIKQRLDRAVSDSEWLRLFPHAIVRHLAMEESDHVPIRIETTSGKLVVIDLLGFCKHGRQTNLVLMWLMLFGVVKNKGVDEKLLRHINVYEK